jgi:hypothetical protein
MHPRSNDDGPHRPRRRGNRSDRNGHGNTRHAEPRGRDSDADRERAELEFTAEMHERLQQFLASDEQGLALEPMNSFRRRIVHNLAKEYNIETESRGEERERHVYLIRTASSAAPTGATNRPAESGEPRESRAPRAPREVREVRETRRPREAHAEDATDFPSSSRVWDFGSQTFSVNPGEHGVHMAVKRDGSVEIFQERDRAHVVVERLVTARQFRVRKNQILQPGEPGW